MSEKPAQRIRAEYEGEIGLRWRRIETGRPATYLEENVVLGRRELESRLLEWLRPVEGMRILDAGCGLGTLSGAMADAGGRVTGIDLVPRFVEEARKRVPASEFVAGDVLDLLDSEDAADRFDVVVMAEVLEDYSVEERIDVMRRITESGIARICLAFRSTDDRDNRIWRLIAGSNDRSIRWVDLLRWVHVHTPYRQRRQEKIAVRNYRAHLSDLVNG